MPEHEKVHLFLPHGHVIDVYDDAGNMIHNFGELTEREDGSFVLSIRPGDFVGEKEKEEKGECPSCGRVTYTFALGCTKLYCHQHPDFRG